MAASPLRRMMIVMCTAFVLALARTSAAASITLQWDPSSGSVAGYKVYVATAPCSYTQTFTVTSGTSFTYTSAIPGVLYYFAVSAYNAAGESTKSTPVASFSDPVLSGATPVKAAHLNELRSGINAARLARGLLPVVWAEPVVAGLTTVRASHLREMRTAIADVYSASGVAAPRFTDPSLTERVSLIKAVHVAELRTALVNCP
jgi:hypothetical protein